MSKKSKIFENLGNSKNFQSNFNNQKINCEIAEILGAFIGDGWIESRGSVIYICGDSTEDKDYYDKFLAPLFSKHFVLVKPKKFKYWNVYEISSCNKDIIKKALSLGFQKGKKCYIAEITDFIMNSNNKKNS